MKKYINIIDYLFYKLYRWSDALKIRHPETTASNLIALLFLIPLAIWIPKQNHFLFLHNLNRMQLYLVAIPFVILINFYYLFRKKYEKIINKYKDDSKRFNIITDILTILFFIFYFIFMFNM